MNYFSWSLDGSVYEGRIESLEEEKVTVRFIGYDNEEIVMKQDLLQSKGKEWRDLQIEVSIHSRKLLKILIL